LAEVALGYRFSRPMVIMEGYDPWYDNLVGKSLDSSQKIVFAGAASPKDAVRLAINLATKKL